MRRRMSSASDQLEENMKASEAPKKPGSRGGVIDASAELQLACGAIRAGINMLLKHAGLQTADLRSVLIAGGFRSFIRRKQ